MPDNRTEMDTELASAHGLSHNRDMILISRSTILLLSGVLLGMALREGVLPWAHFHGFYIGMTGLIAYFGLEVVSRRKAEREARDAHDRMVNVLNSRIEKHVARSTAEFPMLLTPPELPGCDAAQGKDLDADTVGKCHVAGIGVRRDPH